MEENRVRIIDIAEELGLSTATVSNVIHGKTKKISDETVKRVQELLEKRQYIPSMAGILLSQNNSKIVGVVVNDCPKYEKRVLEDAFISSALNALLNELEKSGYFMMVKTTTDWNEVIRYASMWNMDGLVLIGFCEEDYNKLRDKMHIPFVVYEAYFEKGKEMDGRICNITIDNFDGGYQAGQYLEQMGHKNILMLADNNLCMDKERMAGFREGAGKSHVDFMQIPMTKSERLQFYKENLRQIKEYTAIFAVSDFYAIEFMNFCKEQGMEIPEDISVVGFDNISLCENIYPTLTTVGQDTVKRAEVAVKALKKLKAGEEVNHTEILPVKLIERGTVNKIKYSERANAVE